MAPAEITDDYYAVLAIPPSADLAAIKTSYRQLAKMRHPDKNPANPKATAEFQLLHAAYSTLNDPESRRRYDARYRSTLMVPSSQPGPPAPNLRPQQPNSANRDLFEGIERIRREQMERIWREEQLRQATQAPEHFTSIPNTSYSSPQTFAAACDHKSFWPKIVGAYRCSECSKTTTSFAFQCPGCRRIACAGCRAQLRGESSRRQRQQFEARAS